MYTLETLRAMNPGKSEWYIQQQELDKVNALLAMFEANLANKNPVAGDVIVCRGYKKEVVYHRGLIDRVPSNNKLEICVQPQTPFILSNGSLSTSGGYWFSCETKEISLLPDNASRTFWCWDRVGARAGGGMYFDLPVKRWEVRSSEVY